jgi:hypothetical protein
MIPLFSIPGVLFILMAICAFYYFVIKKRFVPLILFLAVEILSLLSYTMWAFAVKNAAVFYFIQCRSALPWETFVFYGMLFSTLFNLIFILRSNLYKNDAVNDSSSRVTVIKCCVINIIYIALGTFTCELLYRAIR